MNSAVDTTTTVTPPALIVQLLDKLALPYRTRDDSPELDPAQRIQAVLVDDAIGALLVLFPRDHLLDLSRVGELTGRQLLAVKPDRLTRMLSKHSLQVLPGLPPLTSSPCLYEERLLLQEQIEGLRATRGGTDAASYDAEMEKLLVAMALKTREIRTAEEDAAEPR